MSSPTWYWPLAVAVGAALLLLPSSAAAAAAAVLLLLLLLLWSAGKKNHSLGACKGASTQAAGVSFN
jgi:hypothetical protein